MNNTPNKQIDWPLVTNLIRWGSREAINYCDDITKTMMVRLEEGELKTSIETALSTACDGVGEPEDWSGIIAEKWTAELLRVLQLQRESVRYLLLVLESRRGDAIEQLDMILHEDEN